MAGAGPALPPAPLHERVAAAGIDLRTGPYARRVERLPTFARKLATILVAAALAHVVIAAGDALMLRAIAERRELQARTLIATAAPGVPLPEDGLAEAVTDLLPRASGSNGFAASLTRVSAALAPLGAEVAARRIDYRGGALVIDLDAGDPGLGVRVRSVLSGAGIAAQVAALPGGVRITVAGA